ncbi:MAG: transglutaminase domain-containing protein [Ginsengibacter sp.]
MKFFLFFTIFFGGYQNGFAQDNLQFENIYANIPSSETTTTTAISAFINKHFISADKKIAAIYNWVTSNIKYDADSIHYVILDEDNEERVTFALRRKKGVCENFAAIFNDLCLKCNIPSFAIEGFTKQNGSIDRTPHVWCAAFVNNQWKFYDPTWDAGYIRNGSFINEIRNNYFQIAPEYFIQTHLPFDPMFQFLIYPITYKEFVNGNFNERDPKRFFNYKDSIESYKNIDRLAQYLSSVSRIKSVGWPSSKIGTKLKRTQLEIEVINQGTDMDLYNSAVSDYNRAIQFLNTFLSYRNNQFQPLKSKSEVNSLFVKTQELIASANIKLVKVNSSKATLTLDTGDVQKKLDDLKSNLNTQETFFKNNFNDEEKSDSSSN